MPFEKTVVIERLCHRAAAPMLPRDYPEVLEVAWKTIHSLQNEVNCLRDALAVAKSRAWNEFGFADIMVEDTVTTYDQPATAMPIYRFDDSVLISVCIRTVELNGEPSL